MDSQSVVNFRSQLNYEFVLDRALGTSFAVQAVNLPGLSLQVTNQATPFKMIARGGDKLDFNPLNVTFAVDENLENYTEIVNWMFGIGFPVTFEQHRQYRINNGEIYSDGTLLILNSSNNPCVKVHFKNLFPFSITDIDLATTATDVQYIKATANFIYDYYTLERITA